MYSPVKSDTQFFRSRKLYKAFILFCLFPYLQIIPIGTDSQPYALIVGIIILLLTRFRKINTSFFLLLLCSLFALFILIVSGINMGSIRSFTNYLNIFIVSFIAYKIFSSSRFLKFESFKFCVYFWLIVGIIQLVLYPSFLTFLISRGGYDRADSIRGATSLAPEPTFYAIVCALYMILAKLNFSTKKNYRFIQLILLFQILFISRSATVIMLLGISFIITKVIQAFNKNILNILYLSCMIILVIATINILTPYIQQYRAGNLLIRLISDPQIFIAVDESVNERFIHVFFSIYSFFHDMGIPHGFNSFSNYMTEINNSGKFSDYIIFFYPENYSRIMSGFGSALFELGAIGLIIPLILLSNCVKIIKYDNSYLFYCILLFTILLNAMPLSNAIIGLIFGNIIYLGSSHLPNTRINPVFNNRK